MTTPTKHQILEMAKQLFFQETMISGNRQPITPTTEELRESGYLGTAKQVLMTTNSYGIEPEKPKSTQAEEPEITEVKLFSSDILDEILKTGLVVAGGKGCGKTNATKIIVSELLKQKKCNVKVFDQALNWLFDFPQLQYQLVGDKTKVYNLENGIYDLTLLDDVYETNQIMRQMVSVDYHNLARLKMVANGKVVKWIVYVIEEAQNIIGTTALMSYENRFWLKAISTGRNLGLSFVFVTQRLADVSTKAIERCNGYLIGKTTGDNDLKKVRGFSTKQLAWLVRDLEVGQFYYWNGNAKRIDVPLYQSHKQPKQYKPEGWMSKLKKLFTSEPRIPKSQNDVLRNASLATPGRTHTLALHQS